MRFHTISMSSRPTGFIFFGEKNHLGTNYNNKRRKSHLKVMSPVVYRAQHVLKGISSSWL